MYMFLQVYLSWSHEKVMPGEEVSLTVLVIEPGSLVGIMVVAMEGKDSDSDGDITEEKVRNTTLPNCTVHLYNP